MAQITTEQQAVVFAKTMETAFADRVRAALKEPLMKVAEAEVDAAVDTALTGLKAAVESWVDMAGNRRVVEILIARDPPAQDG